MRQWNFSHHPSQIVFTRNKKSTFTLLCYTIVIVVSVVQNKTFGNKTSKKRCFQGILRAMDEENFSERSSDELQTSARLHLELEVTS
jgi:hypothetical protein